MKRKLAAWWNNMTPLHSANGIATLGGNIADNVGIKIGYGYIQTCMHMNP